VRREKAIAVTRPVPPRTYIWLLLIAVVALAHAAAFIQYQQPDWTTFWTDQDGYRRLGQVLAATGRFTRYPDAPTFVPEVLRTPGYPAFVAVMYRLFGISQLAVAVPQAAVFAGLTVVVYFLVRRLCSDPVALASALAVALYAPIPYFGALIMTEVWTTFVLTVAMWLVIRAVQRARISDFLLAGAACGYTALCRPVFVLLPVGVACVGIFLSWFDSRMRPARWALVLVSAAIVGAPWFAYNYRYFHRITISPAGGIGRGSWEGSWQGMWPGRVQAGLTDIADRDADRVTLDRDVTAYAHESGFEPEPMLRYVHQWQDIRQIWTMPTDSQERARARVEADGEYGRIALENIRLNPAAWLKRRATRGLFVLWAADTPIRYSDINSTPTAVVRALWIAQVAIDLLAVAGLLALARGGRAREAALLAMVIVYVTLVHFALLTEARQSLPAKPVVIVLAVIGVSALSRTVAPERLGRPPARAGI
jgi:hypothetical protein